MNILKFTAQANNLTQKEIEGFTGITQSRLSRLMNIADEELPNKISGKELILLSELFQKFDGSELFDALFQLVDADNKMELYNFND